MEETNNYRILRADQIPDHIIHEVQELSNDIATFMFKKMNGKNINVALGAINFSHALILKFIIQHSSFDMLEIISLTENSIRQNVFDLFRAEMQQE